MTEGAPCCVKRINWHLLPSSENANVHRHQTGVQPIIEKIERTVEVSRVAPRHPPIPGKGAGKPHTHSLDSARVSRICAAVCRASLRRGSKGRGSRSEEHTS